MILVDVSHAAALLVELRETMRTIPELPDGLRPADWEEAYAIQDAMHDLGAWPVGALKVGCTSEAARAALAIDEPIGGRVPADRIHASGGHIDRSSFHHQPLLESEFALRIAKDITADQPAGSLDDVRTMADAVAPAIELIASRFDNVFGASGPSTVADNSSHAAMVLGEPRELSGLGELAGIAVSLRAGGEVVAEGSGAAVLGDPYRSLEWAIRHEHRRGRDIAAGTWVITGTCTGVVACTAGVPIVASFAGLGEVNVVIAP